MTDRQALIEAFIMDSRDELQLSTLNDEAFTRTVRQWLERLRYIRSEHLNECYRLAMENHSTRAPLIPKELLDAWHQMRKQPGFTQPEFQQQKLCEFWCNTDGLILVDFDGKIVMEPSSKNDMLYVMACPHHRPQGLSVSSHHSSFPKVRKYLTTDVPSKPQPKAAPLPDWKSAGETAQAVAAAVTIEEPQQQIDYDDEVPF